MFVYGVLALMHPNQVYLQAGQKTLANLTASAAGAAGHEVERDGLEFDLCLGGLQVTTSQQHCYIALYYTGLHFETLHCTAALSFGRSSCADVIESDLSLGGVKVFNYVTDRRHCSTALGPHVATLHHTAPPWWQQRFPLQTEHCSSFANCADSVAASLLYKSVDEVLYPLLTRSVLLLLRTRLTVGVLWL